MITEPGARTRYEFAIQDWFYLMHNTLLTACSKKPTVYLIFTSNIALRVLIYLILLLSVIKCCY